jgi:hypothetical protein
MPGFWTASTKSLDAGYGDVAIDVSPLCGTNLTNIVNTNCLGEVPHASIAQPYEGPPRGSG